MVLAPHQDDVSPYLPPATVTLAALLQCGYIITTKSERGLFTLYATRNQQLLVANAATLERAVNEVAIAAGLEDD